jgi:hypothetical protein
VVWANWLLSQIREGIQQIATLLNELRHKAVPWEWGEKQEHAFQALKQVLITAPILQRPDYGRPFILTTDYSREAVGAVLSQKDDEGREYSR